MLDSLTPSPNSTPRPASGRRKKQERKCDFCSQTFFKAEHLARHVRIHTREKPFQCDVCKKSFTRHDTLLRHARSHSEIQRSNSMAESEERFSPLHPQQTISQEPPSNMGQNGLDSLSNPLAGAGEVLLPVNPHMTPVPPANLANQQMSSASPFDLMNEISDATMWNMEYDMTWPSWSVGSDFDLDAMNASIAATIMPPGGSFGYDNFDQQDATQSIDHLQEEDRNRNLDAVSRSWISRIDPNNAHGTVTPMNESEYNERTDVDEVYRSSLTRRLQPRPYDNSLPSTDFLNLCVSLYFSRFHAMFPIVHAPTFRPSMANSLLLISVCSIGSLFIGSASATAQGIKIFETLNKCILNSWERYISRSGTEGFSMIQAAIIGQTFGLLSGIPSHPNLVDAFCGTIISWARRGKLFKEKQALPIEGRFHGDREQLDQVWKSWIHSEQMIRVVLGVHVHDAELAAMFHHEPLLRHELDRTPVACSERLFSASTSTQWAAISLQGHRDMQSSGSAALGHAPGEAIHRSPLSTGMTDYALLEGIGASICESRQQGHLDAARQQVFTNHLISWTSRISGVLKEHSADPFCLMILWHSTFISLFSDSEILERAIGRDGSGQAAEVQGSVAEWASSVSAKRCVMHASMLSNQLEAIHVGSEPAIHVPQSLFRAAIAWYLYAHFAPIEDSHSSQTDFPEILHLGTNPPQHVLKTRKNQYGKPSVAESRRLCALRDMLQRVGHWGISRKFALILGILLDGDSANTSGFG